MNRFLVRSFWESKYADIGINENGLRETGNSGTVYRKVKAIPNYLMMRWVLVIGSRSTHHFFD